MPKRSVEMTDATCDILGASVSEVSASVEMAARILAGEVRDLEDYFTATEWRALSCALRDTTFPSERDPAHRIAFELQEAADAGVLTDDYRSELSELFTKIAALSVPGQWSVVATVQFAYGHAATQLDSAEWWTLAFRREHHQRKTPATQKRSRPRQAKSSEISPFRHTMTAGGEALADQSLREGL